MRCSSRSSSRSAVAAAVQMLLLAPSCAALLASRMQAPLASRMQAPRMQVAGFDTPRVPETMVPVTVNALGDKVNLVGSMPAERNAAQYLGVYTKSMLLRRSAMKSKHGERVGHYEQVSDPNKQIWWDGEASVWMVGDKSDGGKSAGLIGMEAQVSTTELARAADSLAARAAEGLYIFVLGDRCSRSPDH
tara:strand:- start:159 stop:728 length:570 start_codon:yes stop_codon:yes gene_type:complete|eukprot:scaffold117101_cov36-Phaeocystis_antarctica.AAC.2